LIDQPIRSRADRTRAARAEDHCAIMLRWKRRFGSGAEARHAPGARLTPATTAPAPCERLRRATGRTRGRQEDQALPPSNAHRLPALFRRDTCLHPTTRLQGVTEPQKYKQYTGWEARATGLTIPPLQFRGACTH